MHFQAILILTIYFASCSQDQAKVTLFRTDKFVIVDSCIEADHFLSFDKNNNDYPIYYLGKISDTISIGKPYRLGILQLNIIPKTLPLQ